MSRELELILSLKDEFTSHIKRIEDRVSSHERTAKQHWGQIDGYIKKAVASFSAYAIAGKLRQFTSELIDHANKIDTVSKSYQISIERVQQLEYVARQTGTSFDRLANSQKFLNKNLDDMARGKGRAQDHFREIGISATEAARLMKDPEKAFDVVAKKLFEIENPGKRAAAAMRIFGETGGEVLAALGDNGKAMDDAISRFEKLGLALDKKEIKAAQDLGKAWNEVQDSLTKIGASMLSPGMQEFADFLRFVASHSGKIRDALNAAGGALARGVAGQLGMSPDSLRLLFGGSLSEAEGIAAQADKLRRGLTGGAGGADDFGDWDDAPSDWGDQSEGPAAQAAEERTISREEQREQERREREIARIQERAELYMLTEEELLLSQFEREMSIIQGHDAAKIALEAELHKKLGIMSDKAAKEEERRRKEEQTKEEKRYIERLRAQAMFATGMNSLVSAMLGEEHAIAKKFAIADALINTYAGVTEALRSYPPPQSWALAAQTLAMGMRQVSAIRSTSPGSSGGGGGVGVPSAPEPPEIDRVVPEVDQIEPVATNEERRFTQEIHLHNVIGEETWIRNNVAPTLRELQRDGMELIVNG